MAKELIKIDRNGTKYWGSYECDRCGGRGGSENWKFTGWTCYKCGGTGKLDKPIVWKEYTPEYEAKLNERRAKAQAKKLAEQAAKAGETNKEFFKKQGFNENGDTWAVLGNTYEVKDQLKALGCKWSNIIGWHADRDIEGYETVEISVDAVFDKDAAGLYNWTLWKMDAAEIVKEANKAYEIKKAAQNKSEFVGEIGQKIGTEARLVNVAWYDTQYGTTFVYTFEDIWNNVFVWKTAGGCEIKAGNLLKPVEIGQKIELKGTVKDHNVYKEVKQTVLTRCKIEAV